MKYKDLYDIDLSRSKSNFDEFKRMMVQAEIEAPEDVMFQFYFDHSKKEEFIEQYGDLDLKHLRWRFESRTASELKNATIYGWYERWVEDVAKRFDDNPTFEGAIIHHEKKEIVQHWNNGGTWKTAPIYIQHSAMERPGPGIHLVEGHTRLGNLKGALNHDLINADSIHRIWLGSY